ncbi:MAG: type II toxin-antitoxin system death-on-curing family toxin [Bacteroidota bacterium]
MRKQDILLINKASVIAHGGRFASPDNLLNPESLNYIVDAVDGLLFGEPMYQTISDKAAFYMFSIISNHVFHDGNKRTGLEAALAFIELNGYKLKSNLISTDSFNASSFDSTESGNTHLINFTLAVAAGELTQEDVKEWMALNIEPYSKKRVLE